MSCSLEETRACRTRGVETHRLSRSLRDVLTIMERLAEAKAGFRSLTEAIDTTTPAGRMMMQMVGSFAEFERAMLRERTKIGLETARPVLRFVRHTCVVSGDGGGARERLFRRCRSKFFLLGVQLSRASEPAVGICPLQAPPLATNTAVRCEHQPPRQCSLQPERLFPAAQRLFLPALQGRRYETMR